jgi:hypothetical protein
MFFERENMCSEVLRVDKVAWDRNGDLTAISGIRPDFCLLFAKQSDTTPAKSFSITSDLSHPKIANGNLYMRLEGRGATEFWIKIKFGRVVAIGKAGDKGEITAPQK